MRRRRGEADGTPTRYFDVFVEYAKGSAEDILVRITAENRGPRRERVQGSARGGRDAGKRKEVWHVTSAAAVVAAAVTIAHRPSGPAPTAAVAASDRRAASAIACHWAKP